MSDESTGTAPDRRASWVALRTLRQRPAVVGRTEQGGTVYAIGSVRMVLPASAAHFMRLVLCSKCGRETTGAPLFTPDDLGRTPNLVFCDRCARSSAPAMPVPLIANARPAPSQPPPVEPPAALEAGRPPVDEAELVRRLSEEVAGALREREGQFQALSASVAELRAELGAVNQSNRSVAEMRGELDKRIDDVEAQVAERPVRDLEAIVVRQLVDVRADLAREVDAKVQSVTNALTDDFDRLRNQAHAGPAALAGLEELREQVAQLQQAVAGITAAEAQDLTELRASVAAAFEAKDAHRHEALAEGLTVLRSEIAAVREESAVGIALLEAHRNDLTQAMHAIAQETLAALDRRLEALQQEAEEHHHRIEALTASADARNSRLHVLEQKVQTSLQRLIQEGDAGAGQPEERPALRPQRRPSAGALESLEEQLRQAEHRLSKL